MVTISHQTESAAPGSQVGVRGRASSSRAGGHKQKVNARGQSEAKILKYGNASEPPSKSVVLISGVAAICILRRLERIMKKYD